MGRPTLAGLVVLVVVLGLGTGALASRADREPAPQPSDRAEELAAASAEQSPAVTEAGTRDGSLTVLSSPERMARQRAAARQRRIEERRERRRAEARREARREQREERRQRRARRKAEREAARQQPVTLRIGTFNVLGSQHSRPGGSRPGFPNASVRTAGAARYAAKHGVDVLGTQELQADQLRGLQSRTGMAAYPGFGWGEAETDNSVLWDPGVFELVSGSKFTITFMGRPRPQPIVRLRHLTTGREFYVVNTHPSAGGGRYATERANGHRTLVSIVNSLKSEGVPVLVTGDMNDRAEFYCRVVPPAGLVAPNGGSYGDGCRPPPQPTPVDWVVGGGVTWSDYWRDTGPVEERVSDHFMISASATLQ